MYMYIYIYIYMYIYTHMYMYTYVYIYIYICIYIYIYIHTYVYIHICVSITIMTMNTIMTIIIIIIIISSIWYYIYYLCYKYYSYDCLDFQHRLKPKPWHHVLNDRTSIVFSGNVRMQEFKAPGPVIYFRKEPVRFDSLRSRRHTHSSGQHDKTCWFTFGHIIKYSTAWYDVTSFGTIHHPERCLWFRRHQTCHFCKRATSVPAAGPAHGLDVARRCEFTKLWIPLRQPYSDACLRSRPKREPATQFNHDCRCSFQHVDMKVRNHVCKLSCLS